MQIDKKSPIPVYYQLKTLLQDKITSGEYPEGSLIPSERELGEILDISRMTVRQAINQLVTDGALFREKGRGTFVAKQKIMQKNIMSFSDMVTSRGMVPETKILHFSRELPASDIRQALCLDEKEKIFVLKRLRLANDIPVGIEEDYIPERYFPDLQKHSLSGSLYRLFREVYQHTITTVENVIEASRPDKHEKDLLRLPAGTPVLRISGFASTEFQSRLFYERSSYRSDEYRYSVRIHLSD